MIQQDRECVATHGHPAWKAWANSTFPMLVGMRDGRTRWEQLWWQRVKPRRFVLCCIPFFIDDLALGDEVETTARHVVRAIVARSGQATFRVWNEQRDPWVRDTVLKAVETFRPWAEWRSTDLLALSVDARAAGAMAARLHALARQGLIRVRAGEVATPG